MNPFKAIYARYCKAGKPRFANPFNRRVTIVYKSPWLHGTYGFTFKAGQRASVMDAWLEHFTYALRDDMTYAEIKAARANPQIEIIEVF